MGILTTDMKRVVDEQRLGFYATVCEDGSPNLSPKGSTYVLDDDHLFFADYRSRTVGEEDVIAIYRDRFARLHAERSP